MCSQDKKKLPQAQIQIAPSFPRECFTQLLKVPTRNLFESPEPYFINPPPHFPTETKLMVPSMAAPSLLLKLGEGNVALCRLFSFL